MALPGANKTALWSHTHTPTRECTHTCKCTLMSRHMPSLSEDRSMLVQSCTPSWPADRNNVACVCFYSRFPCLAFLSCHAIVLSLSLCWLTSSSSELSLMSPSLLAPTHSFYQRLLIRVMKIQEVSWGSPAWKRNVHLSLSHTRVLQDKRHTVR